MTEIKLNKMVAVKATPGDTWKTYEVQKTYAHASKYPVDFFLF